MIHEKMIRRHDKNGFRVQLKSKSSEKRMLARREKDWCRNRLTLGVRKEKQSVTIYAYNTRHEERFWNELIL